MAIHKERFDLKLGPTEIWEGVVGCRTPPPPAASCRVSGFPASPAHDELRPNQPVGDAAVVTAGGTGHEWQGLRNGPDEGEDP